ncbi:DMT family transporter [Bacillus sp. V5-8f]|uniref:DMT family transporter n=1 Tax=Bacillus sp. V5-8f TaxID=2053044 RepID=UPI000C763B3E|nr:EamA family transporter [Bacillus sp. V5-8f]PLT32682.1 EamA family transporter [Bacillus sp. V5-8f]
MVIVNYLLMCLIFGTTFLAIKIGVDSGLPPFLSAGMRFFIAGLLLFVFMAWRKKTSVGLLFQKEMFLTGLCLTFGTFATLYWAEQYVTSGVAAVLSATGPMMILVIQYLILKQKGNRVAIIGCLIGVIGILVLIFPSISINMSSVWVAGCLVIIIGEVFYASGAIYSKHVANKFQNAHPIALNAAQMMMGGGMLIVLSFVMERGQFALNLNFMSLGSLMYLIVFGSMIGHSLFYWLIARTNPVFPSTWLFISPIIAVLLGHIVYHEAISWYTGIGTLTIITGTVLANFHSIKCMYKKKEEVAEI